MVRAVRYAGKVYQNEMARAVQQLGYGIRLVRQNGEITGFEIEGASDSLWERFSKRRGEIERQIEKFEEKQGRKPTVKEIALITRETRPAELKEIGTAEVLALQRSQLSPEEWTQLQALRGGSERLTAPIQSGQEFDALRASVGHLFERQSVLREHEILAEVLSRQRHRRRVFFETRGFPRQRPSRISCAMGRSGMGYETQSSSAMRPA
jgi:hypothetical protein